MTEAGDKAENRDVDAVLQHLTKLNILDGSIKYNGLKEGDEQVAFTVNVPSAEQASSYIDHVLVPNLSKLGLSRAEIAEWTDQAHEKAMHLKGGAFDLDIPLSQVKNGITRVAEKYLGAIEREAVDSLIDTALIFTPSLKGLAAFHTAPQRSIAQEHRRSEEEAATEKLPEDIRVQPQTVTLPESIRPDAVKTLRVALETYDAMPVLPDWMEQAAEYATRAGKALKYMMGGQVMETLDAYKRGGQGIVPSDLQASNEADSLSSAGMTADAQGVAVATDGENPSHGLPGDARAAAKGTQLS